MILVTGATGFIGFHLCRAFLEQGEQLLALDMPMADSKDHSAVSLAQKLQALRAAQLRRHPLIALHRLSLLDQERLQDLIAAHPEITHVVHLAARPGVRSGEEQPSATVIANLGGFAALLAACRRLARPPRIIAASSSSIYGTAAGAQHEELPLAAPCSVYAVSKLAGELLAETWAANYGWAITSLRFFTVYGPWGRPDMAVYRFTFALLHRQPLTVHDLEVRRDFTSIDDIVAGICAATQASAHSQGHRAYNLGSGRCTSVAELIALLEECTGIPAHQQQQQKRPIGDVPATHADLRRAAAELGYHPRVPLRQGLEQFVAWARAHPELSGRELNGPKLSDPELSGRV